MTYLQWNIFSPKDYDYKVTKMYLSIAACLNHIIHVKSSEATQTSLTDRQALRLSRPDPLRLSRLRLYVFTSLRSHSSSISCIDTNIDTDNLTLATGVLPRFL